MDKLRISAAALAVAMTASMSVGAFATEGAVDGVQLPVLGEQAEGVVTIADLSGTVAVELAEESLGFTSKLTVNGTLLEGYSFTRELPDTWETETVSVQFSEIPAVPAGYIPLRAVAQADRGSASWYPEESMSMFFLNNNQAQIITDFTDMSIRVNGETAAGVSALLLDGVTYIPVTVLNNIEGITVTELSEEGAEGYEITTVNGTPMMKLAYSLMETAGIDPFYTSMEELEMYYGELYGLKAELFTEGAAFLPMMTTPATLILGKVAEGKQEELQTALEAYRQSQEETFSWYLNHNLPMVQDARFVIEGDWFLFLIGNNADETVAQFQSGIAVLNGQAE